jgi:hypothetical protein
LAEIEKKLDKLEKKFHEQIERANEATEQEEGELYKKARIIAEKFENRQSMYRDHFYYLIILRYLLEMRRQLHGRDSPTAEELEANERQALRQEVARIARMDLDIEEFQARIEKELNKKYIPNKYIESSFEFESIEDTLSELAEQEEMKSEPSSKELESEILDAVLGEHNINNKF